MQTTEVEMTGMIVHSLLGISLSTFLVVVLSVHL